MSSEVSNLAMEEFKSLGVLLEEFLQEPKSEVEMRAMLESLKDRINNNYKTGEAILGWK